jgi:hypothetical protein
MRADPAIGYRFIAYELHASPAQERRVWRLCPKPSAGRRSRNGGASPARPDRPCATSSTAPSLDQSRTWCGRHHRRSDPTHSCGPCARRIWVGALGRVGACGDDAAMESFFPAAEERARPPTRDQPRGLRSAIIAWIERTYYRRRRQRAVGRLTPIEYGTTHHPTSRLMRVDRFAC